MTEYAVRFNSQKDQFYINLVALSIFFTPCFYSYFTKNVNPLESSHITYECCA